VSNNNSLKTGPVLLTRLRESSYQVNYAGKWHMGEATIGNWVDLRPEPIYSSEAADEWIRAAQADKPDGLLLLILDRQNPAWPTARKAVDTKIPTVIYSPIGTSFNTNVAPLAYREGVFIASTGDFSQAVYGLKMLRAGAKLREMRFIVIEGDERKDVVLKPFGTKLRYIPASAFLDEYNRTPVSDEIRQLARSRIKGATKMVGCTEQDVLNGLKSYVVARGFLEREQGDGITMNCLGALGKVNVCLPCIAWSTMLDHGIPAACQADLDAAVTHSLVQFLFDRPGFQQDSVAETSKNCLIGAHCTCPSRLAGFDQPPEPYRLSYHHGKRDAVPVPKWKIGQRVTIAYVELVRSRWHNPAMVISAGKSGGEHCRAARRGMRGFRRRANRWRHGPARLPGYAPDNFLWRQQEGPDSLLQAVRHIPKGGLKTTRGGGREAIAAPDEACPNEAHEASSLLPSCSHTS
jgi:hypothetical protein